MLFWKFFFGLFIADLIFTFAWLAYNGLIVMLMAVFFVKGEERGDTEGDHPATKRWTPFAFVLPLALFASLYLVAGWAAFVARYASACSQSPGVAQHWLYYLFGFFAAGSPLIMGHSEKEGDWRISIAAVAYIIFAFSPSLAEWPYGWAIDRVLGSPTVSVGPADEAIARGKAAAAKEDWDSAITECTEAIRLDPKNAVAYCSRGYAYGQKAEYDKELADCTEAIRLDPKDAEAYCYRGAAYGEKREWDKAIADLNKAVRMNPKYGAAYFQRGCVYCGRGCLSVWGYMGLRKGDLDRAITDLTEAIRLTPDCAEAYYCRGSAYAGKDDWDKTIADCTEAIRIKPDFAEAYNGRGTAFMQKGHTEKAQADFTQAKRLGFKPR
jgi:Flp pilus assembly protein TadD